MDSDSLVLLSDDGKLEKKGKTCEDLPNNQQSFREIRLKGLP